MCVGIYVNFEGFWIVHRTIQETKLPGLSLRHAETRNATHEGTKNTKSFLAPVLRDFVPCVAIVS